MGYNYRVAEGMRGLHGSGGFFAVEAPCVIMFRRLNDYGTEISDGLAMIVAGVAVWAARAVGLPPTIVNFWIGVVFVLAGLIVVEGRRIQSRNKEAGASVVRWGFWLFSLCAGVFVAHNTVGLAGS